MLRQAIRILFSGQQGFWQFANFIRSYFYNGPLFQARCCSVGKQFRLSQMPGVAGHARINIGSQVKFLGKVDIRSSKLFEAPMLVLGDRVEIGEKVVFLVNKEIVVEGEVSVASGVQFMDCDAYPAMW